MHARPTRLSLVARTCGVMLVGCLAGGMLGTRAGAQVPDQRIWDGVFTAGRLDAVGAVRNQLRRLSRRTGIGRVRPFRSDADWRRPVHEGLGIQRAELAGQQGLRSDAAGVSVDVEDAVKLDIISYILQSNGFPAGSQSSAPI